jgi:hypothetical protein
MCLDHDAAVPVITREPQSRDQFVPAHGVGDGPPELRVRPAPLAGEVRGVKAQLVDVALDQLNGTRGCGT